MYSERIDKKLSKKLEKLYTKECYSGTSGLLFNKSHESMEKFLNKSKYNNILEIGAGIIPHIQFLKHDFDNYFCLENSKFSIKYLNKNFKNIKTIFSANSQIPKKKFDRIILSHSLEHIYKPEKLLKDIYKKLNKGGVLSIAIPIDPGFLYNFARNFKRNSNKLGLNNVEYDFVNAIEHINSYQNNVAIIKYLFKSFKKYYFPFNFLPSNLNLFCFFQIYK